MNDDSQLSGEEIAESCKNKADDNLLAQEAGELMESGGGLLQTLSNSEQSKFVNEIFGNVDLIEQTNGDDSAPPSIGDAPSPEERYREEMLRKQNEYEEKSFTEKRGQQLADLVDEVKNNTVKSAQDVIDTRTRMKEEAEQNAKRAERILLKSTQKTVSEGNRLFGKSASVVVGAMGGGAGMFLPGKK